MKTIMKVMLGVTFALLLVIGGCTALVGGAVNEGIEAVEAESAKSEITQEQFTAIKNGQPKAEVMKALEPATPRDEQTTEVDTGDTGVDGTSNCVYYGKKDGQALDTFQFCFDGKDRLTSKASY